jgi:hypothetical protein
MVRLGWSAKQVRRATLPQVAAIMEHFPHVDAFSTPPDEKPNTRNGAKLPPQTSARDRKAVAARGGIVLTD